MTKPQSNRDQKSFMLVIEQKDERTRGARSIECRGNANPRIGYGIEKKTKNKVRDQLIRELEDFGS